MAATAVLSAMNDPRSLHPFFTKLTTIENTNGSVSGDNVLDGSGSDQLDGAQDEPPKDSKRRHTRKPAPPTGKTQKTLQEIVNPKSNGLSGINGGPRTEVPNSCPSETFSSSPRRKRRRTSQTDYVEVGDMVDANGDEEQALQPPVTPARVSSPQVIIPASSPLPVQAPEADAKASKTPPKKMLRLNASGKFSSPVSNKSKDVEPPIEAPRRRGRPRKSKEVEKIPLIAVMKYDHETDLGRKIERILSGEERVATEVKATPKKQRTPRKQQPSKPLHPFFNGKPEPAPAPKMVSPRKASAVTPGKLRGQALSLRSPNKQFERPAQDYAFGSALLKDRLMFKHPGAREPAWPDREQAHVRGLDDVQLNYPMPTSPPSTPYSKRKRKAANLPFPEEESLLRQLSYRLRPEEDGDLRPDGFREPRPSLTLPKKLLLTGEEIVRCILRELSAPLALSDEDELFQPTSLPQAIHPALQKQYNGLHSALTPWDEGGGEHLSWTQKYEPSTAANVLQPTREMNVLKEWLTSLTINAVGDLSNLKSKTIWKSQAKPKKGRRRKNDDLGDFLVDSDEDIRDMDELTDPEDYAARPLDGRKSIKSVVETSGNGVKLSNAVLLSGPHGCGKTTAAHAVAKEMGFKIFEISPCERRSGKDVIDKVGDMTENHLVKHHGIDVGDMSATEEPSRNDEAFERDLASGRQGKMNAFFKPKTQPKQKSPKKPAVQKKQIIEAVQKAIKKTPKDQQQSLVLLEEVDLLFKDDKDFWNTIFRLIESSKRPFIMTCNDEDLVPLQAMSLHAILRFSPPPVDLATDYLLLMAASQGHLLKRDAVLSLYQSKSHDFRASIAELDFWCQMGVGDPRGGLSWIYQRYPPGSDIDANGRRLRVVSEGTYQCEMGVLPDRCLAIEDQMLSAQQEFGIDPANLLWKNAELQHDPQQPPKLDSLKRFAWLADSQSAVDVYAGHPALSRLDLTQPPMPEKARSQYIEGMALLQTDECIDYTDLSMELAISSELCARRVAGVLTPDDGHARLGDAIQSNLRQPEEKQTQLTRHDFACFDAISIPSENTPFSGIGLIQSSFDGPLKPIVTDIAPYVRSIVQYDLLLADLRERLTSITGEGRLSKRARTTRAARSALEGGQRATTRRERWFTKQLDVEAVLATGGKDWPKAAVGFVDGSSQGGTETETPASSAEVSLTE